LEWALGDLEEAKGFGSKFFDFINSVFLGVGAQADQLRGRVRGKRAPVRTGGSAGGMGKLCHKECAYLLAGVLKSLSLINFN